jgi:hypothetical protein
VLEFAVCLAPQRNTVKLGGVQVQRYHPPSAMELPPAKAMIARLHPEPGQQHIRILPALGIPDDIKPHAVSHFRGRVGRGHSFVSRLFGSFFRLHHRSIPNGKTLTETTRNTSSIVLWALLIQ